MMIGNRAVDWDNSEATLFKIPAILPHIHSKLIIPFNYFHCYTMHVVELLNYYTNHCTYIKFIKFTH